MLEYDFSLTRSFPYYEKALQCFPYTGKYGSEKTRILAYFTE